MDPRIILIAAVAAGLWYVADKTVEGVKKVNHKIARVFHKPTAKPSAPQQP